MSLRERYGPALLVACKVKQCSAKAGEWCTELMYNGRDRRGRDRPHKIRVTAGERAAAAATRAASGERQPG